jgi:molybdenum cofactor biosynthesis enzyme MoaA
MLDPYKLLKLNRRIKNHRIKCLAVLAADILALRHLSIRMDPVLGCNLGCLMCRFSSPVYRHANTGMLSIAEFDRIASLLFRKAIQVVIGTGAEPTLHPEYPRLVGIARRHKVPYIGFSTNGQRLTERSISELFTNGLDELMISMHGVRKETYERLMPPASYDRLHTVLGQVSDYAAKSGRRIPLRINYTVNPDNLSELADFFSVYGKYAITILQIRPVMDLGDTAYTDKDLAPYLERFDRICDALRQECRARKIVVLAPPPNSTTQTKSAVSFLKPLVHRYVSPDMVWEKGFNWRNETYEDYCRRINWRANLVRMMFTKFDKIDFFNRSLGYDVDL